MLNVGATGVALIVLGLGIIAMAVVTKAIAKVILVDRPQNPTFMFSALMFGVVVALGGVVTLVGSST